MAVRFNDIRILEYRGEGLGKIPPPLPFPSSLDLVSLAKRKDLFFLSDTYDPSGFTLGGRLLRRISYPS